MEENAPKKILCLDMDAFFASVEKASRPYLKDKPIAVVGSGERTIVLSACYAARRKGVKTGNPIWEAFKKCPELTLVKASNKKYVHISTQITNFLKTISNKVYVYSIDEAFIDITEVKQNYRTLAFLIKTWIKNKFNITCSIGVANSYVLSKMASEIAKPDGFYEVISEPVTFIDGFELNKIWGIGKKTTKKLNALGIFTPKDVRKYGKDNLVKHFGKIGNNIYLLCTGLDRDNPLSILEDPKSVSHSVTAPQDITLIDELYAYLLQLSFKVAERARAGGYSGCSISLKIRYNDMSRVSFSRKLGYYTSSHQHIYKTARQILAKNLDYSKSVRLIGVALSSLKKGIILANLEDNINGDNEKLNKLYDAMDKINKVYSNGLITGRSLMIKYRNQQVISPQFDHETFEK